MELGSKTLITAFAKILDPPDRRVMNKKTQVESTSQEFIQSMDNRIEERKQESLFVWLKENSVKIHHKITFYYGYYAEMNFTTGEMITTVHSFFFSLK